MNNKQVILYPSYTKTGLPKKFNSVEAEYGDKIIEAVDGITLAHHGPRSDNPAPCIAEVEPNDLPTVISHIDLDAIGGILAIWDEKPQDDAFWEAAAYIDLNGPHRINNVGNREASMLQAYWAWTEDNPSPRYSEPIDVTETITKNAEAINCIIAQDKAMLERGQEWAKQNQENTEKFLVREDENMRVFISDGIFCSANYWSPHMQKYSKSTIVLDQKNGSITFGLEDNGKTISARETVQAFWGPEAGGHPGIAGSPRGMKLTEEDLEQFTDFAAKVFKSNVLYRHTEQETLYCTQCEASAPTTSAYANDLCWSSGCNGTLTVTEAEKRKRVLRELVGNQVIDPTAKAGGL